MNVQLTLILCVTVIIQMCIITLLLTMLVVDVPSAQNSDVGLNVNEMIEKHQYPLERHPNVKTEDGYLLELQRIPHGKLHDGPRQKGPVLLFHGLLASSAEWVLMGPGRGLAYILADLGYDVWLANARGTIWSRKHVKYDPDTDWKFWDFSWHEIGVYDVPATIDYILSVTNRESLYYIGHSQGGSTFLVMASERPEYNTKIRLGALFSPAAFISTSKTPFAHVDETLLKTIFGVREIFARNGLAESVGRILCGDYAPTQAMCLALLFLVCGPNSNQFNKTVFPELLTNLPAGSSTKQFYHYSQLVRSDCFCKYNHGPEQNLELYDQKTPPKYDLDKVTAPVALFSAVNDWTVSHSGIRRLSSELKNVVFDYTVPYDKFNHGDFLWAIDAVPLLYDSLIQQIMKY